MTNSPSSLHAALPLSTILLVLLGLCIGLCSCQSTATNPGSGRSTRPVRAETSGTQSIDRAYLLAVAKLKDEKQQALEDGRLKELSAAQMRDLEDSFETRLRQLRGQWQEARARHSQMR